MRQSLARGACQLRQRFPGRHDPQRLQAFDAALIARFEMAHAVDFVIEEFDSRRIGARQREDVDDAAAPAEVARFHDDGGAFVSHADEGANQSAKAVSLADAQLQCGFVEELGRHRALCQSAG